MKFSRKCAVCGASQSIDGGTLSQCNHCSMVVYCGEEHRVSFFSNNYLSSLVEMND